MSHDLRKYISSLTINKLNEKPHVFCVIRKKYVILTPEEIIRQCCIQYLIKEWDCKPSLMKVEYEFSYKTQDRLDICVFDRDGKALIIVECKSADTVLGESAIQQISRYNQYMHAQKGIVTNEIKTIIFDF